VAYNRLAQKELQIAQFYLRREKYESARIRLERILDMYSDSKSAEEARKLLKELPNTKEYKQ
jgi:outer membrane protein assembly factor BamD (BamD/ComL family)